MTTFERRNADVAKAWRDNRWLYLVAGILIGVLLAPMLQRVTGDGWALAYDLVPETLGILVTVTVIEGFNRRARRQEHLRRIIREMGSSDGNEGRRAAEEARDRGFLEDGSLNGIYLADANLSGADLRNAAMSRAKLWEANLSRADLWEANLSGAGLNGASLSEAYLSHTNLSEALLPDTDLSGAHLTQTNLCGTRLKGANLRGADLWRVVFDEQTVLPDARYVREDENGNDVYDKYWTPDTDMTRYTDPNHPDFWQPEWARDTGET